MISSEMTSEPIIFVLVSEIFLFVPFFVPLNEKASSSDWLMVESSFSINTEQFIFSLFCTADDNYAEADLQAFWNVGAFNVDVAVCCFCIKLHDFSHNLVFLIWHDLVQDDSP